MAAISTASSPDELRRLCDERTSLESSRRLNLNDWRKNIEKPGKKWGRIKGLSNAQAIRVHRLKVERWKIFEWFDNNTTQVKDGKGAWLWKRKDEELQRINYELKTLTGKAQYLIE